ncbi:MAG: hotdog fold thioesterase [Prevotella sp.]|nr:hotdog fold thioesterase [Prevotella sp.]
MQKSSTPKIDHQPTMAEHLGIEFLPSSGKIFKAQMSVDYRTSQPFGALNGGASLALAEILAGYGSSKLCEEGEIPLGIQVSANHLKSVPLGEKVIAIGELLHQGKSTHVWNVNITTSQGDLVSTVRIVNHIKKK